MSLHVNVKSPIRVGEDHVISEIFGLVILLKLEDACTISILFNLYLYFITEISTQQPENNNAHLNDKKRENII